ncbi:MAG TPA: OsmC family protein [Puia sp.]|nr:OsmC family protein [Puia sp.]
MKISARINSRLNHHHVEVQTNDLLKEVSIAPKPAGLGSSVNGGELLVLSLATCFCNDLYREAAKRNINLSAVEVECSSRFGAEGEAGSDFIYSVKLTTDASPAEQEALIRHTDQVAEIHNTLRKGVEINLIT